MANPKAGKSGGKHTTKRRSRNDYDEFDEIDDMLRGRAKDKSVDAINFRIKLKFKNQKQKELYNSILTNRITFVSGAAGTGKTLISLMAALECIRDPKFNTSKIVLTKPIIEAASSLGFLPGDVASKTQPYMESFYGNLNKLVGETAGGHLRQNNVIVEKPLNFLRGNTSGEYDVEGNPVGWIVIGDEMQNATTKEMKLFISRLGEGSRYIIAGDTDQSDLKLKAGEKSGLEDAIQRFKGMDGVGYIEFTEDDIVRDKFLIEIMKRYK